MNCSCFLISLDNNDCIVFPQVRLRQGGRGKEKLLHWSSSKFNILLVKREWNSTEMYINWEIYASLSLQQLRTRRIYRSRTIASAYCANEDLWIEIYSTNLYIKIHDHKCDMFLTVTEYCWCGIAWPNIASLVTMRSKQPFLRISSNRFKITIIENNDYEHFFWFRFVAGESVVFVDISLISKNLKTVLIKSAISLDLIKLRKQI